MTGSNPVFQPVAKQAKVEPEDGVTDVWRFYERFANEWDRDRSKPGQRLTECRYLDDVTSRLSPGAEVLDLGCGTGEPMARYLIGSGFSVTGVDAAPAMIAISKKRFPDGTWIEADMRTLNLGRRFDAIIAWDSVFHLDQDEQRRIFPIFHRHIAPSGLLLFTSGPEAGAAIGTMYGESLFHASLAPDDYRQLLARSGMQVLLYCPEDTDCGKHTIWLTQADS